MNAPEPACCVCGAPATSEGVLFPTELSQLFALQVTHRDNPERWPSAWCCDTHADHPVTKAVYAVAGSLSPAALAELTNEWLAEAIRTAHFVSDETPPKGEG